MDGTIGTGEPAGRAVAPAAPRSALALAVLASLLGLPQAVLLGDAVATTVLGPDRGATGLAGWPLWTALAVVGTARTILDALATRRAGVAAIAAKRGMRRRLTGAFAAWSPVPPPLPSAGDVAATLVDRIDALDPALVRYPLARVRVAVVPPAILLAIAPVSWVVALLLLAAGPFIPIFMALIGARAEAIGRRQLDEAGALTGVLLDRVRGLATIRALGAGERVAAEIRARGETLRERAMEVLAVAFLSSAALEFFASVGIALAAVYIGFRLMGLIGFGGDFGLAGGVAMLALAPDYFQPLRDYAAAYHDRANARALDERTAAQFGADAPRPLRLAGPRPTGGSPPAIVLTGLTARLPGAAKPVLDGVALTVPAGGVAAVTGPSGAGKTMLLAAVAGFVDADAGAVAFGETDRPAIAWLSQEPLVRQGSVLANLAPDGRPLAAADAWRALDRVGLAAVVRRMPRGLLTPLGETGAGLSRGERRRLTLARALLDPAPVLLADEPTADLDADTAAAVRTALLAMAGRRTVVVATHDHLLAEAADVRLALAPPTP